jgi:hypothetical protein
VPDDHVYLSHPAGVGRHLFPIGSSCWTLDETPATRTSWGVGLMLPREFWRACKQHDWNWEDSDDETVFQRGWLREHELERISEETQPLRDIWNRFVNKRNASA